MQARIYDMNMSYAEIFPFCFNEDIAFLPFHALSSSLRHLRITDF